MIEVIATLSNGEFKNFKFLLNLCMRDCRETNIEKEHVKSHVFDKNADIPTREELNKNSKNIPVLSAL